MEYLLVFLSGLVDRIRGDKFHFLNYRIVDKMAYGWIISALIGHPFDLFTIMFIILFGVGMSLGWGAPMGAYLSNRKMEPPGEKWQVGFLQTNIHAALWVRGMIWGACVFPLMWYDPSVLNVCVAITLAFPLSLYFSNAIYNDNRAWKLAEYVRGWMLGGFIIMLQTFI